MKATFDPVTDLATEAARAALPESVTVGAATLLPRGADPFVGTDRPLLLGATRWTYVAPGGILIGGAPDALAAILGFDLPARPEPVAPEDRKEGDEPPAKWSDLVTEAARASITTFTQAVANPIAGLASLPPECSPTQVSFNDNDNQVRGEAGLTPDAVVLLLHLDDFEVRMVVVVPGIFAARLRGGAVEPAAQTPPDVSGEAENANGEEAEVTPMPLVPQLTTSPLGGALAKVPLDLSLELGQARVPLAQILHLRDGEVIELRQAIDAPVDLVSESTAVARGDLEVSDSGNLVLHVTSIPGRPDAPASPRVMNGRAGDVPGGEPADADAADAADGIDTAGDPPDGPGAGAAIPNPDAPLSDPAPADAAPPEPAAAEAPGPGEDPGAGDPA